MSSSVYRLHSTLEIPLETVHEYFDEDPLLPNGVADVDITRRNNTLILRAVADDDSISKYTPTAQLKASVTETRIYEEDGERTRTPQTGPQWQDEDEEIESELVEYAAFKGERETVLQNTALQYEMFLVLKDLATHAEKGTLTAITEEDDELVATRIVDGEERPATIEVVEGPASEKAAENGVDWRDNKFIS
ncbi:hypothetical protein BRC81_16440 [Halobacteriales archaeon QS_1_68_20]|nr:MAG: hypothetical protein BRC81_16440 [Halobacteriales archaeon QS_1_68_20]